MYSYLCPDFVGVTILLARGQLQTAQEVLRQRKLRKDMAHKATMVAAKDAMIRCEQIDKRIRHFLTQEYPKLKQQEHDQLLEATSNPAKQPTNPPGSPARQQTAQTVPATPGQPTQLVAQTDPPRDLQTQSNNVNVDCQ
eukprot:COSAG02_NODE_23658_length_711_cov_2.550654_2_plen_139_part_00